jgi:hypothetical protein
MNMFDVITRLSRGRVRTVEDQEFDLVLEMELRQDFFWTARVKDREFDAQG